MPGTRRAAAGPTTDEAPGALAGVARVASLSTEPRIKHVVVLMLENRSFDHMLGFLEHPDASFEGLRGGTYYNVTSSGARINATPDGEPDLANPDHSHRGILDQIGPYGGLPSNGGFVQSYATRSPGSGALVMRCLDPASRCPVLAQLAREYAVADHWFSSVPGETWPNRNFAHAATSDGAANIEAGFYYDPTIFEQLASAGISWRIYHDGLAQAWCYRNLWKQPSWVQRRLGRAASIGNWYDGERFFADVASDELPAYSFIEPRHLVLAEAASDRQTNSQHPGNNLASADDFYAGEALIARVYEALVGRPAVFTKTLLLITYDEHGGFYDHVPPPVATPPGDAVWRGASRRILRLLHALGARIKGEHRSYPDDFDFGRLGVRVPAVLISPWIKPGSVVHDQLEHASIPATLRALFTPTLPSLTRRDGAAGTFHEVVRRYGLPHPRTHFASVERAGPARAPRRRPEPAETIVRSRSEFDEHLIELGEIVASELQLAEPPARRSPRGRAMPAQRLALNDPAVLFRRAASRARGEPPG